jgi:ElaB/YqjD/DUF883 family membrane-anchored ribosome-binding protein
MADRNDGFSNVINQEGAAGRAAPTVHGGRERAGSVAVEFVDAARSAAESLLDQQRRQVAERVSGIAEALRSAARSLGDSENRVIGRYADQAAEQIENISRTVRTRRWNEIVADTEDFARRNPALFVLGAVATGFLVGRFLWLSTDGQRSGNAVAPESSRSATTRAVTAAVSSASGNGTTTGAGEAAGYGAGSSGAMEAR